MEIDSVGIESKTFLQLGCGNRCPNLCTLAIGGLAGMHAVALMESADTPNVPYSATETVSILVNGYPEGSARESKKMGNADIVEADGPQCSEYCKLRQQIAQVTTDVTQTMLELGVSVQRVRTDG
jgi:hypothetical protein